MEEAAIARHLELIIPLAILLFKVLIAIIGVIGGALCSILVWLGKRYGTRIDKIEAKLDRALLVMHECDGCSETLQRIGDRML